MIKVKGNTKKGQQLLYRAGIVEGYDLWDVYGKVSSAKRHAMDDCRRWCYETNGRNLHICSHNSFSFSVAWEYDDPETGELMTRIETSQNTYIIDGSR